MGRKLVQGIGLDIRLAAGAAADISAFYAAVEVDIHDILRDVSDLVFLGGVIHNRAPLASISCMGSITLTIEICKSKRDIAGVFRARVFKYYDKEWQELKLSPVMQDQSRTAPDNAVYEMEMRVIRENAADSTENQLSRQAASVLYLDETEHYRIVLNEYVQDLEILFNGRLYAVKHTGNRKTLSLQLVLSEAGVLPKNVIVVNKTNLKADIRVFNVPDISEERRHEYINVESTEGNFSVMYLNEQFKTIENVVYFADISVKKIMENDEELVRIQTQKYVAG